MRSQKEIKKKGYLGAEAREKFELLISLIFKNGFRRITVTNKKNN
jgi:hypothetical protein